MHGNHGDVWTQGLANAGWALAELDERSATVSHPQHTAYDLNFSLGVGMFCLVPWLFVYIAWKH